MPLQQAITQIAAGGTNENLLAGSQFEYLPRPAMLEIGLVCTTAGSANGDCVADINIGAGIVAENVPILLRTTGVVIPDDIYLQEAGSAGARLKIRVRNTAGAARDIQHYVRMTWLR